MLDRDWFEKALKSYYVETFGLTEDGLPPRELLTQLGLDFVIPVIESLGVIG